MARPGGVVRQTVKFRRIQTMLANKETMQCAICSIYQEIAIISLEHHGYRWKLMFSDHFHGRNTQVMSSSFAGHRPL